MTSADHRYPQVGNIYSRRQDVDVKSRRTNFDDRGSNWTSMNVERTSGGRRRVDRDIGSKCYWTLRDAGDKEGNHTQAPTTFHIDARDISNDLAASSLVRNVIMRHPNAMDTNRIQRLAAFDAAGRTQQVKWSAPPNAAAAAEFFCRATGRPGGPTSRSSTDGKCPLTASERAEVEKAMTSSSCDVRTAEKFNPFVNSQPLTSDVDTNRLYPRMNKPTRPASVTMETTATTYGCSTTRHDPHSAPSLHTFRSRATDFLASSCSRSVHPAVAADQLRLAEMLMTRCRLHRESFNTAAVVAAAAAAVSAAECGVVRAGDSSSFCRSFHPLLVTPSVGTVQIVTSPTVPPAATAAAVSNSSTPLNKLSTLSNSPPASRYRCVACSKCYSTIGGLTKHREFHCRGGRAGTTASVSSAGFRKHHQQRAGATGVAAVTSSSTIKDPQQHCPHCDKCYTSTSALKMHIRTHTLPCRCRLCGKAFSRPWLLQGHMRTHTGEKPFHCEHCQRAFADRSNLRAHLQTHYDVKQYNCQVCRRTFSRMSLLLKHRYGACAQGDVESGNVTTVVTKRDDRLQQLQQQQLISSSSRVLSILNI